MVIKGNTRSLDYSLYAKRKIYDQLDRGFDR